MTAASNRAAIYVRVSTAGQEEGSSLATQEERCRAHAEAAGLEVAAVYRETFTGTELWERPQLTALRAAVRNHEVHTVIAYAIDRLSRDPVHLGVVLSEADHAGARVVFVSEPLDDSPEGQLIRFVRGYAAKIEHEKIRERSIRGKRARVDSGKVHSFGPELFGYRRDKLAGVRAIHDIEAATVRQMFRWAGEEGLSVRAIVRRLQDQGTPPPTTSKGIQGRNGKPSDWGRSTVYRMLREAAYKGESYAWRRRRVGRTGQEFRDPSEWVKLAEGSTPPIVSDALWAAVQTRLVVNHGGRTPKRTYLLRGLVRCGVCSRPMRSSPERDRRVYRCSSRETASGPCGGARVPAEPVEAWAWERVSAILQDPSILTAELERIRTDGPDSLLLADRDAARRQLAKVEKQQERLISRFRQGDDQNFPWELVEREIGRAEQEKTQLRASIADVERRLAEQAAAVEQLDALSAYCERVAHNLQAFDADERRLAFEALGIEIVGNGREWSLRGSIPLGDDVCLPPIISSCRARRAPERPCSPVQCRGSCREWWAVNGWTSLRSTASLGFCLRVRP